MKIIAAILLVVGIGLGVLSAGYFFSEDSELCQRSNSLAEQKLNEARAAQGTSRGAALMQEARLEVDSAEWACRNARRTQQSALFSGLGGLTAIIVSVVLLVISRKRTA